MTDRRTDQHSDAALERFLLERAPATAPVGLADAIAHAASALPQHRRHAWLGIGPAPALARLTAIGATLALLSLMLIWLAIVVGNRPREIVDARDWSVESIGLPGSRATVVAAARAWLFAVVAPDGSPFHDEVWRSADGHVWQRLEDQTPFAGASVRGFMDSGSAILAYGSRTDGAGHESIATWVSIDGASWRLLSDSGSAHAIVGTLGERLQMVVSGGPGYVAVGTVDGASFGGAAAWSSTDGRLWTRSTVGIEGIETAGVVRLGSGFLALTRIVGDGVYAWSSSDGVTWVRGARVATGVCCGPIAISNLPGGTPSGAIAIGTEDDGSVTRPHAWTTIDGQTWTDQALPVALETNCAITASWPSCPSVVSAVAADALHVIVAGSRSSGENGPLSVVTWSSADGGRTWDPPGSTNSFLVDPDRGDRGDLGVTAAWAGGPNSFFLSGSTATTGGVIWVGRPFSAPPATDVSVSDQPH